MSNLKTYKFSQLYDFSSGISTKPEQSGHGFPFISFSTVFNNYFLPDVIDDLMDTSEKERESYSVKKGDILLTRTSETIDELAMSSVALKDYPNTTYSGFTKRLRPLQNNVTYEKFMGFYLRSKLFRRTMTNNAVLTLRASLNEQIFSYLDLILPPYKEQIKIGDLLHLLNQKIELNNKINKELEAMAKTLYDYWFVQFDFPDVNGKPYKSSGGKMVYNQELKREIPDGWEVENLASSTLTSLITPKIEKFDSEKIYLSTSEVDKTKIINHDQKITFKDRPSRANMQPIKNSIWFARMKNTKKLILVGEYSNAIIENYIFSTGFAGLRIKDNALYYVWNTINNYRFEDTKDTLATGSTQKAITNESISNINLLVPNENILNQYSNRLLPIFKKIYANEQQNQELANLRDWLLPMLMNGQVRVDI